MLEGMIEYVILTVALIAAVASIYIIYQMGKMHIHKTDTSTQETPKPVDASGQFDASGEFNLIPPFATDQIQSVDDYEYNMVFQNEGDRAITKSSRDFLMSQYPMDWTTQPPSSTNFQTGLASFKESFTNQASQANQANQANPYMAIDGAAMTPPVYKDERDILATYVPKKPNELTTYDAADAKDIVDRIYGAKGLVANLKQTGDNTFTIMSTRPKDEKVVYEDENQSVPAEVSDETLVHASVDNYKSPDPFFTVGSKTRMGKWDYSSWTPGLERMFAPTEPQKNWY